MAVLDNIEPMNVMKYFEELSRIPRGSGNTRAASDYLVDFSKNHNLNYVQDDYNNVIIYKKASQGGSDNTIILQGHIDMVNEKLPSCNIDMDKEGIRLCFDNDYIWADGTTLGADDGIAVSMMLAILESDDIKHPNLECVFTTDEETGMDGAAGLDMSLLKGRTMINLDSEEEGYLLVSCAGGVSPNINVPVNRDSLAENTHIIEINGLLGGHSGTEIDKGRANADFLMGRLLLNILRSDASMRLVRIDGGTKDNAIPSHSEAQIYVSDSSKLEDVIRKMEADFREEYRSSDPEISISVRSGDPALKMTLESTERVLSAILTLPNGIQKMSFDIIGLPETSLSLGILKTEEDSVSITCLVRSSVESSKREVVDRIELVSRLVGGAMKAEGDYPGWEYREVSPLRDRMKEVYKEMFGTDMIVQAMHAGVECGMFAGALPGLDVVSIGPNLYDVHTPNERMDIKSVQRVYKYILKVMAGM